MKKIAVVTATRAEYGLLSPVIKALRKREKPDFRTELIVTGTHLSEEYGSTVREIDDRIDREVVIPVKSASAADISANQAEALVKFTELFAQEQYDAVILLGDRYEMLAIAIAAGNTRTPVFHLCGGDTTEGALDEWIRHSITKISFLHFVTNELSRKRVIQLGEDPERVFNYGSTSIDNILCAANLGKAEALKSVGLPECRYALCTYHPVTMEGGNVDGPVGAFLDAVRALPEMQFIITKSNADQGGARINELLELADKEIENVHIFSSLGVRRYLSLMKHAEFVLGNSSSGIIEAPVFHVPTVNIGDRQKGRLQPESVVNCGESKEEILKAIRKAVSADHKKVCTEVVHPYGAGNAGERIAGTMVKAVMSGKFNLKKIFYDLP